jgi:hypothetical protein
MRTGTHSSCCSTVDELICRRYDWSPRTLLCIENHSYFWSNRRIGSQHFDAIDTCSESRSENQRCNASGLAHRASRVSTCETTRIQSSCAARRDEQRRFRCIGVAQNQRRLSRTWLFSNANARNPMPQLNSVGQIKKKAFRRKSKVFVHISMLC